MWPIQPRYVNILTLISTGAPDPRCIAIHYKQTIKKVYKPSSIVFKDLRVRHETPFSLRQTARESTTNHMLKLIIKYFMVNLVDMA